MITVPHTKWQHTLLNSRDTIVYCRRNGDDGDLYGCHTADRLIAVTITDKNQLIFHGTSGHDLSWTLFQFTSPGPEYDEIFADYIMEAVL